MPLTEEAHQGHIDATDWAPAWDRWEVVQCGTGKRLQVHILHPLTVDEARQEWQIGPGKTGLFNGIGVQAARPIGEPVCQRPTKAKAPNPDDLSGPGLSSVMSRRTENTDPQCNHKKR